MRKKLDTLEGVMKPEVHGQVICCRLKFADNTDTIRLRARDLASQLGMWLSAYTPCSPRKSSKRHVTRNNRAKRRAPLGNPIPTPRSSQYDSMTTAKPVSPTSRPFKVQPVLR